MIIAMLSDTLILICKLQCNIRKQNFRGSYLFLSGAVTFLFRGGYLAEIKSSEEQAVLDGLLPEVNFLSIEHFHTFQKIGVADQFFQNY